MFQNRTGDVSPTCAEAGAEHGGRNQHQQQRSAVERIGKRTHAQKDERRAAANAGLVPCLWKLADDECCDRPPHRFGADHIARDQWRKSVERLQNGRTINAEANGGGAERKQRHISAPGFTADIGDLSRKKPHRRSCIRTQRDHEQNRPAQNCNA